MTEQQTFFLSRASAANLAPMQDLVAHSTHIGAFELTSPENHHAI